MDTSNPGPLLMLGGGVLVALGSILDWRTGTSGLNFDNMGLFGLIVLLSGVALAAVGGIRAFAPQTSLPDAVAGFSLDQILFMLGVTVFLWSFALIAADFVEIGVHLTWIGAAAAVAGTILSMRKVSPAEPPRTF
ncbi:MAG: hypothetical protein ACE367_22670 [Acidimicrobiales bacterium]